MSTKRGPFELSVKKYRELIQEVIEMDRFSVSCFAQLLLLFTVPCAQLHAYSCTLKTSHPGGELLSGLPISSNKQRDSVWQFWVDLSNSLAV